MEDKQKAIIQAMMELGPIPEDVAYKLQELGISGCKRSRLDCPIVNYLKTKIPMTQDEYLSVGMYGGRFCNSNKDLHFETLPQVQEFIMRFDRGEYPLLDQEIANGSS